MAALALPLAAAVLAWHRRRTQPHRMQFIPVNGGSFRIRRKGFSDLDNLEGMPMLHLPIKL